MRKKREARRLEIHLEDNEDSITQALQGRKDVRVGEKEAMQQHPYSTQHFIKKDHCDTRC
jgi:hypothetical protein